ncbi:hypothetical protein [Novosphingopyxis sp.]|uniref:hypothetical protein n=1 Tax=Novosphingopyxis sp. TaxID=2709690 RepID=UPI003B5CADD7
MRQWKYTAAIAMLCASTAAMAMDAQTFYARGQALQKKGVMAMLSSDFKPLMNEMKAAGKSVKAENDAAKKNGAPLYCPPAKGKGMSAEEVLEEFGTVPEAQRRTLSVRDAWKRILIRKYPC